MELARIPAPSGNLEAALASPRADGRRPAVIVIHELFGLNSDIREKAQRFSEMGYVALAPDLYTTRSRALCVVATMCFLGRVYKEPVSADIEACRAWLAARPEVDPERIGVAGFCMGGGYALLLAVRAEVGAAAVFYGKVPKEASALEGVCPVVGGFGGRDPLYGKHGSRLARHLQLLQVPNDVVTYPAAGHGFMSEHSGPLARISWLTRVAFDPAAAEDSWRRIGAFFGEHLRGESVESDPTPGASPDSGEGLPQAST